MRLPSKIDATQKNSNKNVSNYFFFCFGGYTDSTSQLLIASYWRTGGGDGTFFHDGAYSLKNDNQLKKQQQCNWGKEITMFKKTLIASAIAMAALSGTAVADGHMPAEGFIDGSSMDIGLMYYGRERNGLDKPGANAKDAGDIRVHALGVAANYESGYYMGMFGLDVSAVANIDLMNGSGHGQSEVLYWDENKDRSSSRLAKARAKMKYGNEVMGANVKAGYTDIYAGIIGSSSGLHAHSYRGVDAKFHWNNLEISYGWADQFQSDWDDEFETMGDITYIHSLGAIYKFGDQGWIDLAFGQGNNYRTSYHAAGAWTFGLGEIGDLTITSYWQMADYDSHVIAADDNKIDDQDTEWTVSFSAALQHGNWNFLLGYGKTDAGSIDGEYQLRLTPWGESDARNYLQTAAQLDDFIWDDTQVIKFAVNYQFEGMLTGFNAGMNYNYGWDINDTWEGNAGSKTLGTNMDGEIQALDFQFGYMVQEGLMKNLWVGVMPAFLRVDDTNVKNDRNDVKVIATYNISVF